jgi:hypothetical protein
MSILNNYYFMGYKKYIFKTQPYEHQQKALQESFDKPYYVYLWKWVQEKLKFY